jgi:hypothetical protein
MGSRILRRIGLDLLAETFAGRRRPRYGGMNRARNPVSQAPSPVAGASELCYKHIQSDGSKRLNRLSTYLVERNPSLSANVGLSPCYRKPL